MALSRLPDKSKTFRYVKFDREEKKLNSGVEDSMVKLLSPTLSQWRSLKLPSALGIKLENELKLRSKSLSCEAFERELGIVPLS
ncbi:hypothetical protein FH972_027252 [Carpinus fangiana]|uniref:Uncharacterized protein n=1 Tax=Carpinus fangiana TaxID=176857 RepID=A0A5N6L6E9_9ROSI|nr:hypothetical protein FH972_027252 [Carpinus fangiana]